MARDKSLCHVAPGKAIRPTRFSSAMILRLEPPIEVHTPQGRGWAMFLRDYGWDHDDLWTCLMADTKEFWTFRNKDIRGVDNVTFGVGIAPLRNFLGSSGELLRTKLPSLTRLGWLYLIGYASGPTTKDYRCLKSWVVGLSSLRLRSPMESLEPSGAGRIQITING